MIPQVWLLDIAALDGSDAPVTLRFSSAGYIDGANYYDGCLTQPCLFTTSAFGAVVPGSSRSGYGEVVLLNTDGHLDYLADYAMDGRQVTLRLRDDSGVTTQVLRGTALLPSFDGTNVSIKIRDPQQALATPHPHTVYGGTNALPAGVDGVATDIKGKSLPRVFGSVRSASPVLVNTARYIYQVHDGADVTISAVYDRGIALTLGASYTDLADLQANAPAAGEFRAYQGYFRIGSTPTGTITADADSSTTGLGGVFALIAAQAGFTLNASDATALDAVGNVGIYMTQATNTSDMLDTLANSAGGFWSFDALGVIRAQQLLAPGAPMLTLSNTEVLNNGITRKAIGAGPSGLPIWSVTLNADRVETVQTDLASSVPAATVARLAAQTRQAIAADSAVQTRHPLADAITIDTCLRNLSDAQTQATRLGALFGVRRDLVQAIAYLDADSAGALVMGETVNLTTTYGGYSAGRAMVVVGYTLDARLRRATLNLWG